jgi:outer membrane protein assembly factor BamD
MISKQKKTFYNFLIIFLIIFLNIFLVSCSGKKSPVDEAGKEVKKGFFSFFHRTPPPEETDEIAMTNKAMDFFVRGNYDMAEELFQKIKDRYPFSPFATLAELRLADIKFYQSQYAEAITLYEEFEKLHPNNEAIPYVIFQQGMCQYRLIDTPDRDRASSEKLIDVLTRLHSQHPDSPYTFQAERMIKIARENLAMSELNIAKWYLKAGKKLQAAARIKIVLEKYADTQASIEATKLMKKIGDKDLILPEDTAPEVPVRPWWKRITPFS